MSNNDASSSNARRVRLRARYRAFAIPGEGLFLLGDHDHHVLEGQIYVDLLPFLRDGVTETQVVNALEPKHPRAHVHYALQLLERQQLLCSAAEVWPAAEAAFWDELGLDAASAREAIGATVVHVSSTCAVSPELTMRALESAGLRLTDALHTATLHVVLTDDYLDPSLSETAKRDRRDGRTLLLVRATGSEIWVGPFFTPTSACLACLTWWLRTNLALEQYLTRRLGAEHGVGRRFARGPGVDLYAASVVALEVSRWVANPLPRSVVKTFDQHDLRTAAHDLAKRPQCRRCGDPQMQSRRLGEPVTIEADEQPVEVSAANLSQFVSRITGVVTALTPAWTGDAAMHTYTAFFGFGRDAANFQEVKSSLWSQAAGVGTTADEAKVGAVCEALERYSGMYQGDEPSIRAAYVDLDPSCVVHPASCMLYSERQYQQRHEINARNDTYDIVPNPFDGNAPLDWTGVWSLSSERFKLLPSTYLFYRFPQPPGGPYCWADSNGCAAGRTRADAIRRGLYELVERDGVAVWWYNRLRRPRVDLASFEDPYFDAFVRAYRDVRRDVWVLDVTSDLGVPTFVAVSRYVDGEPEDILIAFGAHLDARTAIHHALCEMNHLLPAVLPANRDAAGDYPYNEPSQKRWWMTATAEREPYLLPDDTAPIDARRYSREPVASEADQARRVRRMLEERGFEVLVLDQTRPDVNVPTVKVIVPGLRHFWARFAPGRLYDVPVRMGWLPRPHTEDELNPISMFL